MKDRGFDGRQMVCVTKTELVSDWGFNRTLIRPKLKAGQSFSTAGKNMDIYAYKCFGHCRRSGLAQDLAAQAESLTKLLDFFDGKSGGARDNRETILGK